MSDEPIIMQPESVRAILSGSKTMTRRVAKPQPGTYENAGYQCDDCGDPCSSRTRRCKCGCTVIKQMQSLVVAHESQSPFRVGMRLWVKETWCDTNGEDGPMISYRAGSDRILMDEPSMLHEDGSMDYGETPGCYFAMWGNDLRGGEKGWRPSRCMPRWASRLTLEVVSVKIERLQNISCMDILKEGLKFEPYCETDPPVELTAQWCDEDESMRRQFRHLFTRPFEAHWQAINGKRKGCSWEDNPWVFAISFKRISPI